MRTMGRVRVVFTRGVLQLKLKAKGTIYVGIATPLEEVSKFTSLNDLVVRIWHGLHGSGSWHTRGTRNLTKHVVMSCMHVLISSSFNVCLQISSVGIVCMIVISILQIPRPLHISVESTFFLQVAKFYCR